MVLASSTTSIHTMLLLLLMLFHLGLQASISGRDTHRLTRTLNCSSIVKEIIGKLPEPELKTDDEGPSLRNKSFRRVNLSKFVESQGEVDPEDRYVIKSNLQKLNCCLPTSANDSALPGVFIRDLDDFRKKLRFYMVHLNDLETVLTSRPPQPASGSVSPNRGTVEC
ncbi:interleukin-3 precursor [Mus musculus]|uniref:Interleukin-3 n=2 Tax=Mus musculus TaxID=10090 RepID=IL3_MOUSE|eukprot:NP_034686.2 interleukin-3 precursor [Mus musculus]